MDVIVRSDLKSLALCFLISSSDVLTTYLFLSLQKGVERGLIVGLLLSYFGLMILLFYMPIEALIIFFVFKAISKLRSRFKVRVKVEYAFLLTLLLVPLNNALLLLF
jgi:hypothetical protein